MIVDAILAANQRDMSVIRRGLALKKGPGMAPFTPRSIGQLVTREQYIIDDAYWQEEH